MKQFSTFNTWSIVLCFFLLSFSSCVGKGNGNTSLQSGIKSSERLQLESSIRDLQKELPLEVPGMDMTMISVEIVDNMIAYTYSLTSERWKEMGGVDLSSINQIGILHV